MSKSIFANPLSLAVTAALVVVVAGCSQPQTSADRDAPRQREETLGVAGNVAQPAGPNDDARAQAPAPVEPELAEADEGRASGALRRAPEPMPTPMILAAIAAPKAEAKKQDALGGAARGLVAPPPPATATTDAYTQPANTEKYAGHDDNPVQRVAETPVSTFSIDVDTGAYSNVRRMIDHGALPPRDAVRAEEFVNYFDYAYTPPASLDTPFSVTTEIAPAPWNAQRQLLLVGIKGYEVAPEEIPASNLVLLIDTSGSMQTPTKLPLLKAAFKQLVPQLRREDRVSIVVYAGSAGMVLPPTAGDQHDRIIAALDALEAGGSTNGGAGIDLAYSLARKAYVDGGVNRVVLATDGDFNVGTVDTEALKTIVAEQRRSGIALTTLGFGEDNYNDEMAEQLADIGNGNHAYIDTLDEARKVFVDEMSTTMLTIAKDVKIQIEFNPQVVAEYRLIGYENRMLRREDFGNDAIDAGEIGAGHDVTALYELTLVGSPAAQIEPLRYATTATDAAPAAATANELGFLRLRYKRPDEDTSRLIESPLRRDQIASTASPRLRFAAAVAAFADSLRGGTHLGTFDLAKIAALARDAQGQDRYGYQAGFIELVGRAQALRGEGDPKAVAVAR